MENWKRALVFGSLGAGAFLVITGRRPAAVVAATIGLATLASEYPEKVEQLWRNAPEYLEKGNRLISTLSRVAEKFSEQGMRGGWRDIMAGQSYQ